MKSSTQFEKVIAIKIEHSSHFLSAFIQMEKLWHLHDCNALHLVCCKIQITFQSFLCFNFMVVCISNGGDWRYAPKFSK